MRLSRFAVLLAFVVLGAACTKTVYVTASSSPGSTENEEGATNIPPAEGAMEESSSPVPVLELGATANNPYPLGKPGDLRAWSVKVAGFTANADAAVAHENMFNDKPKPGYHYLLVTLKTSNIGTKSGDPYWDLTWSLIGSDGRQYNDASAVLPNDLSDAGNVPPGAFAQGNVAFQVKDGAKGLVLYIEDHQVGVQPVHWLLRASMSR